MKKLVIILAAITAVAQFLRADLISPNLKDDGMVSATVCNVISNAADLKNLKVVYDRYGGFHMSIKQTMSESVDANTCLPPYNGTNLNFYADIASSPNTAPESVLLLGDPGFSISARVSKDSAKELEKVVRAYRIEPKDGGGYTLKFINEVNAKRLPSSTPPGAPSDYEVNTAASAERARGVTMPPRLTYVPGENRYVPVCFLISNAADFKNLRLEVFDNWTAQQPVKTISVSADVCLPAFTRGNFYADDKKAARVSLLSDYIGQGKEYCRDVTIDKITAKLNIVPKDGGGYTVKSASQTLHGVAAVPVCATISNAADFKDFNVISAVRENNSWVEKRISADAFTCIVPPAVFYSGNNKLTSINDRDIFMPESTYYFPEGSEVTLVNEVFRIERGSDGSYTFQHEKTVTLTSSDKENKKKFKCSFGDECLGGRGAQFRPQFAYTVTTPPPPPAPAAVQQVPITPKPEQVPHVPVSTLNITEQKNLDGVVSVMMDLSHALNSYLAKNGKPAANLGYGQTLDAVNFQAGRESIYIKSGVYRIFAMLSPGFGGYWIHVDGPSGGGVLRRQADGTKQCNLSAEQCQYLTKYGFPAK